LFDNKIQNTYICIWSISGNASYVDVQFQVRLIVLITCFKCMLCWAWLFSVSEYSPYGSLSYDNLFNNPYETDDVYEAKRDEEFLPTDKRYVGLLARNYLFHILLVNTGRVMSSRLNHPLTADRNVTRT